MRIPQSLNTRNIWRLLLFGVCAFLFAWNGLSNSGKADAQTDVIGYFIGTPPANSGVIVFVHGLTGDGVDTWTNTESKEYWPYMLRRDPTFSGYDVYVVQYPTPRFSKSYTIDEVSDVLYSQFVTSGVSRYKQIIFIAHSMGGIIVRSLLLKRKKLMDNTAMIYFYATPVTGSYLAHAMKVVSQNPQARDLTELSDSTYLSSLYNAWIRYDGHKPECFCAYETLDTKSMTIVSQDSARALCSAEPTALLADHISIVKPENRNSRIYTVFKNAFEEIVRGAAD